jgi:hypothetical protein
VIVLMKSMIEPTGSERVELSQRTTRWSGRADDRRRARLMLLLEAGHPGDGDKIMKIQRRGLGRRHPPSAPMSG